MSPADFRLILRGVARGRFVQFDRPDWARFQKFIADHQADFADLQPAIEELACQEPRHRRSLPDVTHHRLKLLTDPSLRRCIREGTITGWRHLGRLDEDHAARLTRRPLLFGLLYLVSLIPLLGRLVLKVWGHAAHRRHVKSALTSWDYLCRAMRGARIETLITWQRAGRAAEDRARRLVRQPVRYWAQRILLGWWPATWHRAAMEPDYAWARIREKATFLARFLREPSFREDWLLDQVRRGREEGMLTPSEADKISEQVKDPYIQKYLKCAAVHLCTVPVTQIVMVLVGAAVVAYSLTYRGLDWPQAMALGAAAAALIQLMPISPGSMARGLFVLGLMVKERDVRNYYIAAPVSFLHVIGYLAFPLQMVAHDPALARFMAGRWAKSAAHVVPVFGENGALLEHAVFDLFFNTPLTFKRLFRTKPLSTTLFLVAVLAVLAYPAMVLATLAYAGYLYLQG